MEAAKLMELGKIESTLFVPLRGRIYASEHFPAILHDRKALSLKEKLPEKIFENDRSGQYPLIASASRSANMDRYAKDFMHRKTDGALVQLGCGLETAFYRNDDGRTIWYEVDLPDVIAYRQSLLPNRQRDIYLASDAFSDEWIRRIRTDLPEAPLLIMAGGLFHYFEKDRIIGLMKMLQRFGDIEMVFDAVSKKGMNMMMKKYMRQMGHGDAKMFFYVDDANELAFQVGGAVSVLSEKPFYRKIPKKGLKLSSKTSMALSDKFKMVKIIHMDLHA